MQLIQDYEDYAEVNKQLEKMGYNIGTRLIEEFLARSSIGRCADFKEVGEVVAKVSWLVLGVHYLTPRQIGFKSFLNITPTVTYTASAQATTDTKLQPTTANSAGAMFSLVLDENPLAEFVELPDEALEHGLWFSNVLCGVLRGALEMVIPSLSQLNQVLTRLRFRCRYKPNLFQMFCEETKRQRSGYGW